MAPNSTLFIATFLLLTFCAYGQMPKATDRGTYFIDPQIKSKVDEKTHTLNGVAMSAMDFIMFENDSITYDTYRKGKSFDECFTMTSLRGDTIDVTGFLGMFVGFGYRIALAKNTYLVLSQAS